jgi:hypothetical protein
MLSRLPAIPSMSMPPYEPRAADRIVEARTPLSWNSPPSRMLSSAATGALMEKAMGVSASRWNC